MTRPEALKFAHDHLNTYFRDRDRDKELVVFRVMDEGPEPFFDVAIKDFFRKRNHFGCITIVKREI